MTTYSLDPAFIVLNWHSARGLHKMTIPTKEWNSGIGTNGQGGYDAWDTTPIDAQDMVMAFADAWKALNYSANVLDECIIFTQDGALATPVPVRAFAVAVTGTGTIAPIPATMQTWTLRSANFHHFKLVLLDVATSALFTPITPADTSADQDLMVDTLNSDANAWSARDNSRPTTLIKITSKLSDVLRHVYRLD